MLAAAVALGVVFGLLVPGPSRYARPRATALVVAAAAVQVGSQVFEGWRHTAGLVLSLALAAAWLAVQRHHLASTLLSAGALMNLAVIAANGGMPVDPDALRAVGRSGVDVTAGFLYKHVPMDSGTHLAVLADRIPVPVQRNVISIGDVLMAVAITLWVADSVRGWRFARRSPGAVDCEHRGRSCREVIGSG
jgi:hypothetical protein